MTDHARLEREFTHAAAAYFTALHLNLKTSASLRRSASKAYARWKRAEAQTRRMDEAA